MRCCRRHIEIWPPIVDSLNKNMVLISFLFLIKTKNRIGKNARDTNW